jgi:tetratricopeptide (TPR) repeat protein
MIAHLESDEWQSERRRWTNTFTDQLRGQLQSLSAFAQDAPAQALQLHVESFLAVLNMTAGRPQLAHLWLDLVDALHPLPVRWGYWIPWLSILQTADHKAKALGQTARRAEYLGYLADLYLNTGQLKTVLDHAHEAISLAERSGAVWPLGVAGNAAAGALRAQAEYSQAQALIDNVRGMIAALPSPDEGSRRVLAMALLDLEEMDLLRYFKRMDDAIALGEALIARLESMTDIDPHDLANAYRRRATITWVGGRYQESAQDLRQSAALFRRAGDPLQATFSEGNLGLVYYSMARYDQAEQLMLAAVRAAEEINARHRLVSDLGDLSVVYIALGRMDRAYDFANRMASLAADMGIAAELSRARSNRGYALMALGRYDEAREDIEFSLKLYQEQGRLEGTISTSVDYVLYLQGIGEGEQAAALAQEIYDAAWREEFPHLQVVTTRCLARFRPAREQADLLRRALALAREHERPMDEAGCLFSLAALAETPQERSHLYRQAVDLVHDMGCPAWLAGRSEADPPDLPMTI